MINYAQKYKKDGVRPRSEKLIMHKNIKKMGSDPARKTVHPC